MLRLDPYFKTYLPKTIQLKRIESLFTLLQTKPQLFLKPQSGSQGRSVLRVIYSKENDGSFEVTGRDGRNRSFHKTFQQSRSFKLWLSRFVGKRAYLIQEYLSLHTDQGMAYDIRSLVQKNGRGLWVTTGMAVRCGKPGSVTSNLHGGGTAEEVMPFLIQQFGAEKAEELKQSLDDLSARIPLALESSRGRLAELGIDFGIDRMANLWILEVNSKPGRDIFKQLHNTQARRLSLLHPIQYAGFLLQRKPN
ncbi:Endospore coat-associated protein YheD [compost metagenome]